MYKFACLCPVYGIPPRLIEESIQCFLDQTHPEKLLIIYDDMGTVPSTLRAIPGVEVMIADVREPTLIDKYEVMMMILRDCDAFSMWDVDDLYLPNHLAEHDRILRDHPVSYPNKVWSTYTGEPQQEETGGRFWASMAMRVDAYHEVGGFVQTSRADFDQQSLRRFLSLGHGSGEPTYVFRWGDTQHAHGQGSMRSADDTTWYDRYQPSWTKGYPSLTPGYSQATRDTLQRIRGYGPVTSEG